MTFEKFKLLQKEELEKAKSAARDPIYNAFYMYQHISFPNLFKRLGSRIVEIMKIRGYHAVTRYLKKAQLLSPDDYHATLHEYDTYKKAIVHVHFPTVDAKVIPDHRPTLCYNIYMCFDFENEDNNMMYYPEIASEVMGNKFLLCGYRNDANHFTLNSVDDEGKPIKKDFTLRDIEERFINLPN